MFLEAVNELNEESPGCPPLSLPCALLSACHRARLRRILKLNYLLLATVFHWKEVNDLQYCRDLTSKFMEFHLFQG